MRDFIKDLRDSQESVEAFARYLQRRKLDVIIPPTVETPSYEERMDYMDECDIWVKYPVEVKQRKHLSFPRGPKDWPKKWDGVNVMAVHAWEHKDPKPLFVATLDKTMENAVIVHQRTREHWSIFRQTDGRDGRSQNVYRCPLEHCTWINIETGKKIDG